MYFVFRSCAYQRASMSYYGQGGSLWEHCDGWLQKVLGELFTITASHKSIFL